MELLVCEVSEINPWYTPVVAYLNCRSVYDALLLGEPSFSGVCLTRYLQEFS